MNIKCPRCKSPLYLEVHTIHTFTIKEIGITDVVPDESMESERYYKLNCLSCNFSGWIEDYQEEARGVVRLHGKRGSKHERDPEIDPEIG